MTTKQLSENYSHATLTIHRLTDELYERLHNESGDPNVNWERVLDAIRQYKKELSMELDLVKTALDEFHTT